MQRYQDAIVINSLMPTSVGIIGNTVESFTNGVERNRRAGVTHASASIGAFHTKDVMFRNINDTDPVVAVLENKYGWNESEVRGFLGENLMRIYKANWD